MSNLTIHHEYRMSHSLSWRAEYILGHIADNEGCKMGFLRDFCIKYHSIPDIVHRLVEDGFVEIKREDNRAKYLFLAPKGKEYIDAVNLLYQM